MEKGQQYGNATRKYLVGMVDKRQVQFACAKIDHYGRLVAKVITDGKDVCLEMLKAGLAWHYKHFDQTEEYAKVEIDAKSAKCGL